jgi:predicted transcriptional regulator
MMGEKGKSVISKITPALCRAARGLLDMNQVELASAASVSKNVIVAFEKGRTNPTKNNLAAIQRVLEEAGVEFTNGDAPGLRLRKKKR